MRVMPKENAKEDEKSAGQRRVSVQRTQSVGSIEDEEKDRQSSSIPNGSLQVVTLGVTDGLVVNLLKNELGAKGLGCPNGRYDLFSYSSTFGSMLEGELHIL
jgi:hypothetical protein